MAAWHVPTWHAPTVKVEAEWSADGRQGSSLPPMKTEDGDVTDHEMPSWSETSDREVSSSLGSADTLTSWQVNNSSCSVFWAIIGLLLSMYSKVRNSTCPLARDKWIFRRTTKIANIVVRRTTWIAAGSVTRQRRSSYFGVRF